MATVKTYDPGKHHASLAGISLNGYAKGTYIKVARMTESFKSEAGAGGDVCRIRLHDKRGTITITLMPQSPTNDLLSALYLKDEFDGSGVGVFSLRDSNGTTVVTSTNAWIKKPADLEQSDELPNREWELECENLSVFIGGNF